MVRSKMFSFQYIALDEKHKFKSSETNFFSTSRLCLISSPSPFLTFPSKSPRSREVHPMHYFSSLLCICIISHFQIPAICIINLLASTPSSLETEQTFLSALLGFTGTVFSSPSRFLSSDLFSPSLLSFFLPSPFFFSALDCELKLTREGPYPA